MQRDETAPPSPRLKLKHLAEFYALIAEQARTEGQFKNVASEVLKKYIQFLMCLQDGRAYPGLAIFSHQIKFFNTILSQKMNPELVNSILLDIASHGIEIKKLFARKEIDRYWIEGLNEKNIPAAIKQTYSMKTGTMWVTTPQFIADEIFKQRSEAMQFGREGQNNLKKGEYESAIDCYYAAIKILKLFPSEFQLADDYDKLRDYYHDLSYCKYLLAETADSETAIQSIQEALNIIALIPEQHITIHNIGNIAWYSRAIAQRLYNQVKELMSYETKTTADLNLIRSKIFRAMEHLNHIPVNFRLDKDGKLLSDYHLELKCLLIDCAKKALAEGNSLCVLVENFVRPTVMNIDKLTPAQGMEIIDVLRNLIGTLCERAEDFLVNNNQEASKYFELAEEISDLIPSNFIQIEDVIKIETLKTIRARIILSNFIAGTLVYAEENIIANLNEVIEKPNLHLTSEQYIKIVEKLRQLPNVFKDANFYELYYLVHRCAAEEFNNEALQLAPTLAIEKYRQAISILREIPRDFLQASDESNIVVYRINIIKNLLTKGKQQFDTSRDDHPEDYAPVISSLSTASMELGIIQFPEKNELLLKQRKRLSTAYYRQGMAFALAKDYSTAILKFTAAVKIYERLPPEKQNNEKLMNYKIRLDEAVGQLARPTKVRRLNN